MARSELPRLGRALLASSALASREDVLLPSAEQLALPEKVVQFGTGAFLRGFIEYWIDAANRRGTFDGRIVAVSSTDSGGARDAQLTEQDGLYTLVTRGIERGEMVQEQRIIGSLSRALSAKRQWDEVLRLARNPELELVVSNTTEVGIALDEQDDPAASPPRSFPGKLTRFLYERATAFAFEPGRGVVVLPCELIDGNGDKLREIVLELAHQWGYEPRFAEWIRQSVPFANTLVDRIVPGAPAADDERQLESALGYRDDLLTTAEPYRLFAIEDGGALGDRLGFGGLPGIVLTDDIGQYRERKVRLLNGSHTIMVPAALLCGCETVGEVTKHDLLSAFLRRVMFDEIVPTVHAPDAEQFAHEVLDRFANPFIRHSLWDIAFQGTTKMRFRVVPSIVRFADLTTRAPASMALGFAMHLLLMRGDVARDRRDQGWNVPEDTQGERITERWRALDLDEQRDLHALDKLVEDVCADRALWGTHLEIAPGFGGLVLEHLVRAIRFGVPAALDAHLSATATA